MTGSVLLGRRLELVGKFLVLCTQHHMNQGYICDKLGSANMLLYKVALRWFEDRRIPTGDEQYFRPRLHRLNLQILLIHFLKLLQGVVDFFLGSETRERKTRIGPVHVGANSF